MDFPSRAMDFPRRVVILGATGSVGRHALEVVAAHPDLFEVVGLVAGSDGEALEKARQRHPQAVAGLGTEAAVELAASSDADVVLNAIVGAAGLQASVAALEAGKTLALANKESLVAGGVVCRDAARRGGGRIAPVDSEHAALAQCLEGRSAAEILRLVLTASGGPFRTRSDLSEVTVEEALAHPTWAMGPKVTIDSATMMNKGLEVLEAHYLFDVDFDRIEVVVHPQSLVHGAVELADGSFILQAAPTDMRLPVAAALAAPLRLGPPFERLDLAKAGALEFEPVDGARFPLVALAYEAGRSGRSYPAAMNAANEVAVGHFLDGRIAFLDIAPIVTEVVSRHDPVDAATVDEVLAADAAARLLAVELVEELT